MDTAMTRPAPAPRFGQFYFSRKTATAYELYIFGGATAEFAPVLLNDMWRLTIPLTLRSNLHPPISFEKENLDKQSSSTPCSSSACSAARPPPCSPAASRGIAPGPI